MQSAFLSKWFDCSHKACNLVHWLLKACSLNKWVRVRKLCTSANSCTHVHSTDGKIMDLAELNNNNDCVSGYLGYPFNAHFTVWTCNPDFNKVDPERKKYENRGGASNAECRIGDECIVRLVDMREKGWSWRITTLVCLRWDRWKYCLLFRWPASGIVEWKA